VPTQAQSKVLGPVEIISETGPVGRVLDTIPYTNVRGSQILITVVDNWAALVDGQQAIPAYMAGAEVELVGVVQAVEFVLKRQYCRMFTGPMFYVFDDAEAYDNILLRARNMSGGRRGNPGGIAPAPTAANGFSLKVQAQIQPRGGLGPKPRFQNMG
jgi:hypothetical protein